MITHLTVHMFLGMSVDCSVRKQWSSMLKTGFVLLVTATVYCLLPHKSNYEKVNVLFLSKWSGLIMWNCVWLKRRFTSLTFISHFAFHFFLHTSVKWQFNFFANLGVYSWPLREYTKTLHWSGFTIMTISSLDRAYLVIWGCVRFTAQM